MSKSSIAPALIDAHTHIHFPVYDSDRGEVFLRAKNAGVKMVTVGTQLTSSREAVLFAESHQGDVWATVGFHPAHFSANWYHDKNEQNRAEKEQMDIGELKQLALSPSVVAIGECGLDYFRDKSDETIKRQKEGLVAQIELAAGLKKPLMIHCRAAFPDLIEILEAERARLHGGITHFFSGSAEDARKLLEFGFYFTFGGVITFARDYDGIIKMIPLDRILSETDAPYVSPAPYRGKRNEPAYVVEVVKKLAELKGVSVEKMSEQIWQNAKNAFLF